MKVYITCAIPESGIKLLRDAGHEVVVSAKDGVLTKVELVAALKEHNPDAVIPLLTDTIDAEVMDAAPNARVWATYSVGFNHIDLEAAKARNLIITNTPDVLTETVAEHTAALIMTLATRVVEADTFTRKGLYSGWAPMLLLGTDLQGKTLGVLGAGRIGSRVAEIMHKGLGMAVAYYDVRGNDWLDTECKAQFYATPDELLKVADVVTVHVPLLDSTHHLINAERLAQMKSSALLVNTSRGPVIDEVALVVALQNKTIKGAALDVFENEPTLAPGLTELSNVILTPHIASASEETRSKMATMAAQSVIDVLSGKEPEHRVTT